MPRRRITANEVVLEDRYLLPDLSLNSLERSATGSAMSEPTKEQARDN